MADGTTLNFMSGGDIIQTEDFGGSGKMERIKVVIGNRDVDGGDISVSNPMPVQEQFIPQYEDNTNQVAATQVRPVAASSYSPNVYTELTQVTKANIKSTNGNVFSIYITNANATVRYFQLHNKTSAPAGTDVPIYSIPVPAGTTNNPGVLMLTDGFFMAGGHYFSLGIGWAISTTYGTFTDSATAGDHISIIHWI